MGYSREQRVIRKKNKKNEKMPKSWDLVGERGFSWAEMMTQWAPRFYAHWGKTNTFRLSTGFPYQSNGFLRYTGGKFLT